MDPPELQQLTPLAKARYENCLGVDSANSFARADNYLAFASIMFAFESASLAS